MKILLIIFLLGCGKNIRDLVNKNKIGDMFWQYIREGKVKKLVRYIKVNKNNININKDMNEDGEIALTLATKLNKRNIVELLLDLEDIDVNSKNQRGKTALIVSILEASSSFIKYEIIDHLLSKGASVNATYGLKGNNTLMLAIIQEEFYIANKLLSKKDLSINYQNLSKETALMLAIKSKTNKVDEKERLISKLLEIERIDENLKDKEGKTVITYAITGNNHRILGIFLKSFYRNFIINELLKKGEDVNNKYTDYKSNMLMLAVEGENVNIIEKILSKNSEINYQNLLGETALILAIKNKNIKNQEKVKVVEMLLKYEGINLNLSDNEGKTAFMYAVIDNNPIIVGMLFNEKGLRKNLVENKGMTAFDYLNFQNFKIELAFSLVKNSSIICQEKVFYENAKNNHLEDIIKILINNEGNIKKFNKNFLLNCVTEIFIKDINLSLKLFNYFEDKIKLDIKLIHDCISYAEVIESDIFYLINFTKDKENNLFNSINMALKRNKQKVIENIFLKALLSGNKEIIELLIRKNFNINYKDENGNTPLIQAFMIGDENIVKMLIEKGADVNYKDKDGKTPLISAAVYANENMIRLFLENGADVNCKDNDECPALIYAVKGAREILDGLMGKEMLRSFKDAKEDEFIALFDAAFSDKSNVVRTIIENGADVNYKDKDGNTALIYAIKYCNENTVKLLIEKGAEFNYKDKDGNTLLIDAAIKGMDNVVRMLIKRGVDVNYKDKDGNTALIYATKYCNENTVKLLIEKGAEFNYKDKDGNTPLINATVKGMDNVVRILIERGVDVNYKDKDGNTPLIYATEYCNENTVKLLIEKGAEFNYKDKDGNTPLINATVKGMDNVVRMLIERGADVNCKDKDGNTPLISIVINIDKSIVKLLIEKGAEFNYEDEDGKIPLIDAAIYSNENIVRTLIERGADVNYKDVNKCTALIYAIKNTYEIAVRKLIKNKKIFLDFEEDEKYECITLIINKIGKCKQNIVRMLIKRGADVNYKDRDGNTPLIYAFYGYTGLNKQSRNIINISEYINIVKLLVDKGANIDFKNEKSNITLINIIKEIYEGILEELVISLERHNFKEKDSYKTSINSIRQKFENILNILVDEKKLDINSKDKNKYMLLINSFRKDYENITEISKKKFHNRGILDVIKVMNSLQNVLEILINKKANFDFN